MPSGSLQWVHRYDGIDKDTRVDRLFQADSTNSSSRPLNGIVKPFLFFDSSIGNRITLCFQINVFVLQFLCCSAPHSGEVKKLNDGLEIAWQVIVEFYEFCWVHESLTNIIRLIQQLDVRLVNYISCYSGE